jgi:hypothetical protein
MTTYNGNGLYSIPTTLSRIGSSIFEQEVRSSGFWRIWEQKTFGARVAETELRLAGGGRVKWSRLPAFS